MLIHLRQRSLYLSSRRLFSTAPRPSSTPSSQANESDQTHFGFRTVPTAEKQDRVSQVFAAVAPKYDLMNDVMSFGVHRLWKDEFVRVLDPQADSQVLDVAGGTGDIAFRIVDRAREESNRAVSGVAYKAKVTVLDINPNMLAVGRQRQADDPRFATTNELTWVEGNAEKLPFEDNSFDAYTIAFGIRNCTHIDRVLSEAHRVLRPGGRFLCLEFGHVSPVEHPLMKLAYDAFSFQVIPTMGELVAQDRPSYQYLVESIRKFPPQAVFAQMIRDAGFTEVQWQDLTFGVAAIHSGWKQS
jgi:2-methoxy-6-polyprenyl-1,4-benzoquinol methylase